MAPLVRAKLDPLYSVHVLSQAAQCNQNRTLAAIIPNGNAILRHINACDCHNERCYHHLALARFCTMALQWLTMAIAMGYSR